jgi:hypothetical protein
MTVDECRLLVRNMLLRRREVGFTITALELNALEILANP